jgi:hypothetical protein
VVEWKRRRGGAIQGVFLKAAGITWRDYESMSSRHIERGAGKPTGESSPPSRSRWDGAPEAILAAAHRTAAWHIARAWIAREGERFVAVDIPEWLIGDGSVHRSSGRPRPLALCSASISSASSSSVRPTRGR